MLAATGLLLAVPLAAGPGGIVGGSSSRVGALESLRRKISPDRTIHVQIVRSGDSDTYTLHVSAVSVASGSYLL
jgi:hypothetical protein